MANVYIDSNLLTQLAQTLGQAANILNNVISQPVKPARERPKKVSTGDGMCPNCSESYMYCACKNNPLNKQTKKKVKPSKQLTKDLNILLGNNVEIVNVEEEDLQAINEDDKIFQHKPLPSHVVVAKRATSTGLYNSNATVDVKKKPGEMKFLDVENVGDRIPAEKYPAPSERRNPAKKFHFVCDRCRCNFEAYPTELPQAFMREKIPTGGEDKPRVYCDGCSGIGK